MNRQGYSRKLRSVLKPLEVLVYRIFPSTLNTTVLQSQLCCYFVKRLYRFLNSRKLLEWFLVPLFLFRFLCVFVCVRTRACVSVHPSVSVSVCLYGAWVTDKGGGKSKIWLAYLAHSNNSQPLGSCRWFFIVSVPLALLSSIPFQNTTL